MKKFFGISIVAVLMTSSAMAAPPEGSCLGGCLGTAIAAPTPVIPAGYQCKVNWPLPGLGSCLFSGSVSNSWAGIKTFTNVNINGVDRQVGAAPLH